MLRRSSSGFVVVLAIAASGLAAVSAHAQTSSTEGMSFRDEWLVMGGLGTSIGSGSRAGHQQAFHAIEWARPVSGEHGSGVLRGRLAMAIELTPVYVAFQSNRVEGIGISPLVFRWNLREWGPIQPYLELAGGVVGTNHDVPEGTTRWNFTTHGGVGGRVSVAERWGVVAGYRFHHLSNANTAPRNPGINSNVGYVGLSYRR